MNTAKEHWEQHYGERDRVWSGRVNVRLVEVASTLEAGRALDLGCGEGADACWLAERGWTVVAVDISDTALQRAAAEAGARGLGDRIDFAQHDLSDSFPGGTFDLISAQFLHSTVPLDRPRILSNAADAVRPGGVLLIVDHAGPPPWASKLDHHHEFPSGEEVVGSLDLDDGEWQRVRVESVEREATRPDGQTATWLDNVIVLRRRGGDQVHTDEYIRQLKALAADYSTEDLLSRITADTLVIHGRQDRVVPEEEVEFLADGIAGAVLALIEEAGHCSPIEQPQAFTAVMRLWLMR